MKTKAVRLYGTKDLRLEEFDLPEIREDEILVKIISDSVCMSTYKCAVQGTRHRRVPQDIAVNPTIVGHECAGNIVQVGRLYQDKFYPGMKFALQPAFNYRGCEAVGYSYRYFGGDMTYGIIPPEGMIQDCVLEYTGDSYYQASLAEPMSCIIGAFHASYHTKSGSYEHVMGPKPGGAMALLGAAGPMGLGSIDYALHGDCRPDLLVVTDIDAARLERARQLFLPEEAAALGTRLEYVNTGNLSDPVAFLKEIHGGKGYDDVFVYAQIPSVVEQAAAILCKDGCLNFFAGPIDTGFSAKINMYDVHYNSIHLVGTSGGTTEDMREALALSAAGKINPAVMITHVGGLDAVIDTTLNLPSLTGGKKLIYNHIEMPLTAIEDFAKLGETDERFAALARICGENKGLWSKQAEEYVLRHWMQ